MKPGTKADLLERNRSLQERLAEAEETLRALRCGEVDAVIAWGPEGDQVYTLRGADEAYRVMVQNMAEGALTLTRNGLILFSNEQFAMMLGMPLERVIGSFMSDFVAAEDASVLTALLAGSSRVEGEARLKGETAAQVPAHISANQLRIDETDCVCLIVTDLSEQKRNQKTMAAERLANSILDQAAAAILVVNPRGKIIRASRAAAELAGEPVLLRKFDDIFKLREDAEDAHAYPLAEIISLIGSSGRVAGIKALAQMPDGRKLYVLLSASLLAGAGSKQLGCIVLFWDVTGLKRAEQQLRESEELLRLVVNSALDIAIFALDSDGCLCGWNRGAAAVGGYSKEEVMGRHFSIFFTEEDRAGGKVESLLTQAAEKGIAHEEIRWARKNGELFWAEVTMNVLREADGSLRGFSGFARDFSNRRNAAAERMQLISELEEGNRDLAVSNADLRQFAYAVSHDLREPLRMVSIHADLLARNCKDCKARPVELLDGLADGTARMRALIRDILTVSRVSQFDRRLFQLVDLNEAVRTCKLNLAEAIAASGAEVVCEHLSPVTGDFCQIELIFENLIDNAIKYRGQAKPRIFISAVREGGLYRVSVRDNGPGIDPRHQARIFGLFKRLQLGSKVSGNGIGLAIVQRVVERHGGRAWVESEAGKGATFLFTLPLSKRQEAEAAWSGSPA